MNTELDFSQYTLDELYQSASGIDRDKYPERAKRIDDLIMEKESQLPYDATQSKPAGSTAARKHRLGGALIDMIVNILATIPLLYLVQLGYLQSRPILNEQVLSMIALWSKSRGTSHIPTQRSKKLQSMQTPHEHAGYRG